MSNEFFCHKALIFLILLLVIGHLSSGQSSNQSSATFTNKSILDGSRQAHITGRHNLPSLERTQILEQQEPKVEIIRKPTLNKNYHDAFNVLMDLNNADTKLSIKKAVFTVENAYFEGNLDYDQYDSKIKDFASFILTALHESGLDPNAESSRHYFLYKFMCDTLNIQNLTGEGQLTHYPFQYDFDDFRGDSDWSNLSYYCKTFRTLLACIAIYSFG